MPQTYCFVYRQNKSYIQDIHSPRSVDEFVNIIAETDFHGVSGRINFANGHSRLSNIKVNPDTIPVTYCSSRVI